MATRTLSENFRASSPVGVGVRRRRILQPPLSVSALGTVMCVCVCWTAGVPEKKYPVDRRHGMTEKDRWCDATQWGHGVEGVCCDRELCTKTFFDRDKYEREKQVYEMGLSYVPSLIRSDDTTMSLVTKKVGEPLGSALHSVPIVGPYIDELWHANHAEKVRDILKRFHDDTGLYHNDAFPKNVIQNVSGKLFLIDFEFASSEYKPRSSWERERPPV